MSESTQDSPIKLNTGDIVLWRSIVTFIVFIITNLVVLFPFHIPLYFPPFVLDTISATLQGLRITRRTNRSRDEARSQVNRFGFVVKWFPMNFITAPLIADLFLLAISAIGRQEVYDGTVGTDNINPIDIMVFFLTLAYIAISIDASGLIRFLAFKVLSWGGKVGHRLFFYLYAFFFGLGSFIGNDPIILSGTAFLAYMTRVSDNIEHPRAWIHTQFAVANIASAILVSSNPTNLVLSGAFGVRFVDYTANMIVPVLFTAIVMFPFLLYVIFADQGLIPIEITMHKLPDDLKDKTPINPNIPNARGAIGEMEEQDDNAEQVKNMSLEEIMNPFVDKGGATFGALIMGVTLVTVLALNAASSSTGEHPVFYVTLPAAVIMLIWDLSFGWLNRKKTREIARNGRREIEEAREARQLQEMQASSEEYFEKSDESSSPSEANGNNEKHVGMTEVQPRGSNPVGHNHDEERPPQTTLIRDLEPGKIPETSPKGQRSLVEMVEEGYRWCQETFPTVTAVLAHLPFALIPFAFCMFILVESLVTKGWVPVFAYGWDHWVAKTGTIGAIGGMGFLAVILCNFAGTNIGTTILLSRVIQTWYRIREPSGGISERDWWATIYAMALGVNYGAFSTTFSASLAGLLWRDILARKHIHVKAQEFARVNLPIIAVAMVVGCSVLIGEVWIFRSPTQMYYSTSLSTEV